MCGDRRFQRADGGSLSTADAAAPVAAAAAPAREDSGGSGSARPAPACRIPGCTARLTATYNQTHRICPEHRKALRIPIADDIVLRYCQQCAKLHTVDEFGGERRSCQSSLVARRQRKRERQNADEATSAEDAGPRPGRRASAQAQLQRSASAPAAAVAPKPATQPAPAARPAPPVQPPGAHLLPAASAPMAAAMHAASPIGLLRAASGASEFTRQASLARAASGWEAASRQPPMDWDAVAAVAPPPPLPTELQLLEWQVQQQRLQQRRQAEHPQPQAWWQAPGQQAIHVATAALAAEQAAAMLSSTQADAAAQPPLGPSQSDILLVAAALGLPADQLPARQSSIPASLPHGLRE